MQIKRIKNFFIFLKVKINDNLKMKKGGEQ